MSGAVVAYYRVSTPRQGKSGLGLEAQRKAVATYAASQGLTVAYEFTEIETGKGADALVFATALQRAKKLKAPIVVAKLDRLSRDVAFIATLMTKKVEFVAADDPTKSPFMLHIKAAVAQEERRMIAQRTREALAAAKERGVKLGNQAQADANKAAAAARDANLRPIFEAMRDRSLREIAMGVDQPRHPDAARRRCLEPGHGHARVETIGHHGQMNGSPRDVRATHREWENFRQKAIWISKGDLSSAREIAGRPDGRPVQMIDRHELPTSIQQLTDAELLLIAAGGRRTADELEMKVISSMPSKD
jgi:DNA invertase Pin-like site-specific DNA recombinase